MSTKYSGVNYALTQQTIPSLIDEGGSYFVKRYIYDSFVLTADLAAGDTILMGSVIPESALLLGCQIATGALGGSCTIDVGWLASASEVPGGYGPAMVAAPTGFFSALPVSSATNATAYGSTYTTMSNWYGLQVTAPVQPVIAEHAVSSGGTGIEIQILIEYGEQT